MPYGVPQCCHRHPDRRLPCIGCVSIAVGPRITFKNFHTPYSIIAPQLDFYNERFALEESERPEMYAGDFYSDRGALSPIETQHKRDRKAINDHMELAAESNHEQHKRRRTSHYKYENEPPQKNRHELVKKESGNDTEQTIVVVVDGPTKTVRLRPRRKVAQELP
jgi:hypothetical protein